MSNVTIELRNRSGETEHFRCKQNDCNIDVFFAIGFSVLLHSVKNHSNVT